ncbi:MAG: hypothetical protein IKD28_01600, partial [Clostridia bacterium]|nr:hypothetical protein [Clostridia bacterium]
MASRIEFFDKIRYNEKKAGVALMKYDTILLDADETLLDFPRSESEAVSDALRLFDITPTEELIAGY